MRVINKEVEQQLVNGVKTEVFDISQAQGFSVHSIYSLFVAAAVASADIDDEADTFTKAAHGFVTGVKGQVTTDDALPDGLATSTDYFVIVVDANTFQLAASLDDALAGTAIDLEDAGAGTQTFTPTALSGGTVKIQASNDVATPNTPVSNWIDVPSMSQAVSAAGDKLFEVPTAYYKWMRIHATVSGGQFLLESHVTAKGDN